MDNLSLNFIHLSFETGSLIGLEVNNQTGLAGQLSPGDSLPLFPSTGLTSWIGAPGFFLQGFFGWYLSPCLCRGHSTH